MGLNTTLLLRELEWLAATMDAAIRSHFQSVPRSQVAAPRMDEADLSPYAALVREAGLSDPQRLALCLALAPDLKPEVLDPFLVRNPNTERLFSEFGGDMPASGGFLPTIETALFLVAGDDLGDRLEALALFAPGSALIDADLIAAPDPEGPRGGLRPAPGVLETLVRGRRVPPRFGAAFPARPITTDLDWDDLILSPRTNSDLQQILAWIDHAPSLLARPGVARRLGQGYRCLFAGPSGTGKTLTAALLGKRTGREVYWIDLSQVVSKWVGETEKNLSTIFDRAEGRDWILFFDEADALFGKRSEVSQAQDRYANIEVAYILQRIEVFSGVAILASNLRGNIDSAFQRRFQSVVRFAEPGPAERLTLWRKMFAEAGVLASDVDLGRVARDFEVTGGAMVNVLRQALLASHDEGRAEIDEPTLIAAIERELLKSGKI